MKEKKFSVRNRLKSFGYAFNGLMILWKNEHNIRIHLLLSTVVVILGFVFHLSLTEWALIILAIGLVLAMEMINSSLEYLADHISPQYHEQIKRVKDIAATAVLVAALSAMIIGLIIFLPKLC